MTESQFTAKLLKALRAHPALKDAVIWKLNDRTTKGIPDICIVWGGFKGRALFIEIKMRPKMPEKIQSYYLERLGIAGGLLCASDDGRSVALTIPYPNGTSRFMDFENAVEELATYA